MASKKKGKHHPSPKARAAYNRLIIKAYKRLHNVVKQHAPDELINYRNPKSSHET
jgi:hypothetical protein